MNTPQLLPVDLDRHPRRDHFRMYSGAVPCSFAMTVPVDVTGALAKKRRTGAPFYALMIHAILRVANLREEFRYDWLDRAARKPGLWSEVGANFTFFHEETKTFSSMWLPWMPDESLFVEAYVELTGRFRNTTELVPQGRIPENALPISMIPWAAYTGFQVNLPDPLYLRPVITMGMFEEKAGRAVLPFTLQMHHATGDGWHASEAIRAIEGVTKA